MQVKPEKSGGWKGDTVKQLLGFLKDHKRDSILAPLFKMLEAAFDLVIPLLVADIINRGIAGGDVSVITSRVLLMVLLGAVGLACSITAQYFAARAAVEASAGIRRNLYQKIQSLSFSQTDRLGTSTLITRMTSDVNQVQNGLNMFLRLFLRSPFIVLGAVILAFFINLRGALIFTVTIPLLSAAVLGIMLCSIPRYEKVQAKLDGLTGLTRENLTGVRVIRAFGREKDEVGRFKNADSALLDAQLKVGRLSALMNPLTFAIINAAIVAILYVGGAEVNTGGMAVGDVVALVNYMNQILLELIKLANLIIQITKATACAQRIGAVLAMTPDMVYGSNDVDAEAAAPAVVFDHVSLTYGEGGEPSLQDISFSVQKGQTVGIIGGTGSGKTSLVNLIARYYDATSGQVTLFGRDICSYDQASLRGTVGTVMQKAQLFSGTIRDNLRWGGPQADDAALNKALQLAQAAEIVSDKAQGLDEPVEQGGRNFSGGQRQRLSIARTLAAKPEILILDDASSALDYATDAALRRALADLDGSVTLFIVSQRAVSLQSADLILVLDEGRLVGAGTHKALLAGCPVYQDICGSQDSGDTAAEKSRPVFKEDHERGKAQ
jgi:ATP-binding cassette subfamily B multidrug efflux pump